MDEFEIKLWDIERDDLVTAFAALLKNVFNTNALDREHFLWKHRDNPLGPSIVVYARTPDNGDIVAVRAFLCWKLIQSDRVIDAFQPCDTATAHAYRRRGLFSKLTRTAMNCAQQKGGRLLYNFPNEFSRNGYLRLGWQSKGRLATLVRPTPLSGLKRILLGASPVHATSPGSSGIDIVESRQPSVVTKAVSFYQNMEWKNCIHGVRDAELYQWRLRRPGKSYEFIDTGHCTAFVRIANRGGFREACIMELAFRGNQDRKELLSLVSAISDQIHPDLITTILTDGHPFLDLFRHAGFLRVRNRSSFVVYSFGSSDVIKADVFQWALSGFDIDTF